MKEKNMMAVSSLIGIIMLASLASAITYAPDWQKIFHQFPQFATFNLGPATGADYTIPAQGYATETLNCPSTYTDSTGATYSVTSCQIVTDSGTSCNPLSCAGSSFNANPGQSIAAYLKCGAQSGYCQGWFYAYTGSIISSASTTTATTTGTCQYSYYQKFGLPCLGTGWASFTCDTTVYTLPAISGSGLNLVGQTITCPGSSTVVVISQGTGGSTSSTTGPFTLKTISLAYNQKTVSSYICSTTCYWAGMPSGNCGYYPCAAAFGYTIPSFSGPATLECNSIAGCIFSLQTDTISGSLISYSDTGSSAFSNTIDCSNATYFSVPACNIVPNSKTDCTLGICTTTLTYRNGTVIVSQSGNSTSNGACPALDIACNVQASISGAFIGMVNSLAPYIVYIIIAVVAFIILITFL